MANQELIEFIREESNKGKTNVEITSSLLGAGWDAIEISEALDTVTGNFVSSSKTNNKILYISIGVLGLILMLGVVVYFIFFNDSSKNIDEKDEIENVAQDERYFVVQNDAQNFESTQTQAEPQTTPQEVSLSTKVLLEETPYNNDAYGFSINPPKGWKANDNRTDRVSFENPDDLDFDIIVGVNESRDYSIDKAVAIGEESYRKAFKSFKVESKDKIKLNGADAVILTFTFSTTDDVEGKIIQLIAVKNGYTYSATSGTASIDIFDKYKDVTRASFMTFKIKTIPISYLLETKPYVNKNINYSIKLPKGWDVLDELYDEDSTIIFYNALQEETYGGTDGITMIIKGNKNGGESLDDIVAVLKNTFFPQSFPQYKSISDVKTTINGVEARLLTSTFVSPEFGSGKSLDLVFIKNGFTYALEVKAAPSKTLDWYRRAIDASFASFTSF